MVYWEDLTDPLLLDASVEKVLKLLEIPRAHSGTKYPFVNADLGGVEFEEKDIARIREWMSQAIPKDDPGSRVYLKRYYEGFEPYSPPPEEQDDDYDYDYEYTPNYQRTSPPQETRKGNIFYRSGVHGHWRSISGSLEQVSVSCDGEHVWGVDAEDNIFYRSGIDGNWTSVPGKLMHVSVSGDGKHVWGVDKYYRIFHRSGVDGKWSRIHGALKQVSVSCDGNHIWGANMHNDVYHRSGLH